MDDKRTIEITLSPEEWLQLRVLHHACRTTQSVPEFLRGLVSDLLAEDAAMHSIGPPTKAIN